MAEKVAKKVTELVGHTPLLELSNTEKKLGLKARIVAKVEYFNPAGSVKDRIAKAIIDDAIQSGKVTADSVIIEPTSGNTGIGLAMVAASYGLRAILTMPETMSVERRSLLKAYGAEIVLTDGAKGMNGAIEKANELAAATPHSFIPGQFVNPVNPRTHYLTTGPEIWEDLDGKIDAFVAGVGTGGTFNGLTINGNTFAYSVSSTNTWGLSVGAESKLGLGKRGPHKIQGIGAGFVPDTLDTKIYDEVIKVENEAAFETGRNFGKTEGVLVGISAGAAIWAALELAKRPEFEGKTIVALLPDTGDRYLSTPLFSD